MTSDERLDRLDKRVEALAQSVELLATLHRDLETKFEQTNAMMAQRFSETLGFINRLAHIAGAHDQRLDNLEHE
jgi:hypothetical protein